MRKVDKDRPKAAGVDKKQAANEDKLKKPVGLEQTEAQLN